ncbi:deoxyribodipyrimidine photo-lyase [Pseudomonas typographi]|uniref:deoxyribodipyrimidine photo-lyase n=1 Tax=Pseudomonas typographi TaxID=2715964 RepID=UPI001685A33C|nr:deoxyribodipyrimidine photo-lyase [Pseudomonas typographi]MBD1589122.1 deoxyribodipyrimidine photo-lyase [Pseudomonas typographi]
MAASLDRQLLWLRTDLRVHDNTALAKACGAGPTLALYLISPGQWQQHDDAPCKVDFWLRNLKAMATELQALNVPLLIRSTPTWAQAPQVVAQLCQEHGVQQVHCNREHGFNETRRDAAVAGALEQRGVGLTSWVDATLFEPGTVLTRDGHYFKVFGQFRKVCMQRLQHSPPGIAMRPSVQAPLGIASDGVPDSVEGFAIPPARLREHWPAGEGEARRRLGDFIDARLDYYASERDLPSRLGTSTLSAYLSAGVISPRQCLQAALQHNNGELDSGNAGAITWIGELIWREFYKHVLVGFPRVSMHRAFRRETEALPWRHAPSELQAWQQGRTGIPIIDAAMRQLLELGWMHNRLRMLVAMFLSKNLLIDWREGERFFMRHLIDGDLAANNGGWQWSASTGTDSVPYFRLFNPLSQSEKFDHHGVFLKQWLPELRGLASKEVHNPAALGDLFGQVAYPKPIVDLKHSRERALSAFRNL